MKIITSIHIYNFHLFISYLDEGVRIIPFHDFREGFHNSKAIYPKEISHNKSLQEIVTTSHILLGINDSNISTIGLNQNVDSNPDGDIFKDYKANQLSFDYSISQLHVLAEEIGIVNLDFKNPFKSKLNETIIPKSFEKLGSPTVSNMISFDKSILLSIRGFGVSKIDNYDIQHSAEETYRTEDAQDVLFFKKEQMIAIADGIDGLLIFKIKDTEPLKRIPLPNADFPQEIKHFYSSILIKGKKGLYLYNLHTDKLRLIQEGRIGAISNYYNYIIYSSSGLINLLTSEDNGFAHFKLRDESELDIKFNKYLR